MGPGQKCGFLGYRGFFSPTFKSMFSIFIYSKCPKRRFNKIRDFQTSIFSIFTTGAQFEIFTCSECRKFGLQKIRDFQTSLFSGYSPQVNIENTDVRKSLIFGNLSFRYSLDRCLEIQDFQTCVFLIFTYCEC